MKFFHILWLVMVTFLSACNIASDKTSNPEETPAPPSLTIPANFYKKLKGKIGEDIFITIDLIKRRDSVNKENSILGHYYYDKIGTPIDLTGTLSDSGSFELREYDNKGESTGIFKGKFISENEAQGTWSNPKTKKEYPFQLKADQASNNLFTFSEYYNENCKGREICMKSTKKDTLSWLDTMCCSIKISLITLADANNKVNKKINEAIVWNLLSTGMGETAPKNITELLHSIDDYGVGDIMEAEYNTGIVSNEENILSLSVSAWENSGGAHPNGVSYFLNFDKRTGDTISLLEIVKPETIDELVARSKQQFVKENGDIKETGWFFDEGEFIMPKTFSIGKGGLLFQYQSYEAGPYAMGAPQFFLSCKQIKDIVRAEFLK